MVISIFAGRGVLPVGVAARDCRDPGASGERTHGLGERVIEADRDKEASLPTDPKAQSIGLAVKPRLKRWLYPEAQAMAYSWRSATTGSMREARSAGSRPETMPTSARMKNETSMMPGEARRTMSPSWLAVLKMSE